MERRQFAKTSAMGAVAFTLPSFPSFLSGTVENRFGVAEASYMMRWYRNMPSEKHPPFENAIQMAEHCASLGFGGVQVGIRNWDNTFCREFEKRLDKLEMFAEGQIKLPKNQEDVERFAKDVMAAKKVGIDVLRAACLSGRRYENFERLDAFLEFRQASVEALKRAEPILAKNKMKLAIENHKDWKVVELLEILKQLESEWIGVTLDTGNNIALLEDPMYVVEKLAPYTFTVHLKDMAVQEYEDGFLLSEVILGQGFLDIEKMVGIIKKGNPNVRFNLEMITRDPLKIPCLTNKYWATFEGVSAVELAGYLHKIRSHKAKSALPQVSDKAVDVQLGLEVGNNHASLQHAREHLGFK